MVAARTKKLRSSRSKLANTTGSSRPPAPSSQTVQSVPSRDQEQQTQIRTYTAQWAAAFLVLIFATQKDLVVTKWLTLV